jgi:hypothetical protein
MEAKTDYLQPKTEAKKKIICSQKRRQKKRLSAAKNGGKKKDYLQPKTEAKKKWKAALRGAGLLSPLMPYMTHYSFLLSSGLTWSTMRICTMLRRRRVRCAHKAFVYNAERQLAHSQRRVPNCTNTAHALMARGSTASAGNDRAMH